MSQLFAFWKPQSDLILQPQAIFQLLFYGEDAEGIADLPIHEIIAAVKQEFPQHEEKPGLLSVRGAVGHFDATWSWQHFRVEGHDLVAADVQQLMSILRQFGCGVYDSQANSWTPPS